MTTTEHQIGSATDDRPLRPYQADALEAAWNLRQDITCTHLLEIPTAGGKTLIGLELIARFLRERGVAAWMAPSWEVIDQAEATCQSRFPHIHRIRVGGRNKPLPAGTGPAILFTTHATLTRRGRGWSHSVMQGTNELLKAVVIDEHHRGVNARFGWLIHQLCHGQVPVYGLTATPRADDRGLTRTAYSLAFSELVGKGLAQPVVREIATGVSWNPQMSNNEVSEESLGELADSESRNDQIVQTLAEGHALGDYRRVIVFACNVQHALDLDAKIRRQGIPSRAIYYNLRAAERAEAIAQFRNGRIDVLVNVSALCEGFDVPEIEAVFLTRPTASLVLLKQMIGRGARTAFGKDLFYLVEFTDNVKRLGGMTLFHARDVVTPISGGKTEGRGGTRSQHYAPLDAPMLANYCCSLGRLPYVVDRTFGVEIELACKRGTRWSGTRRQTIAKLVIDAVRGASQAGIESAATPYHGGTDPRLWHVEADSSCGWELVSPILCGSDGIAELERVCSSLTDLVARTPDLEVNHRCGLHLTLGSRLDTPGQRKALVGRVTRLEPGLYTLVAPSRLYRLQGKGYDLSRRNYYCRPLCESLQSLNVPDPERRINRHSSINLSRTRSGIWKVEIRLHSGTTEFRKIGPWLSLWMLILNLSRYVCDGSIVSGFVFSDPNKELKPSHVHRDDLFTLLAKEKIVLNNDMHRLLRRRRTELASAWTRVLPLRVAAWRAAGWYE